MKKEWRQSEFLQAAGVALPCPEWHEVIDSTNNRAKALAEDGAPEGTAVIAAAQTKGRGRLDRSFSSETGGLYMSVILRPALPPSMLFHMTAFAAVAAAEAVESLCPRLSLGIKWVNDLLLFDKKVAGILTEAAWEPSGRGARHVIVGIGINVKNKLPPQLLPIATTLQEAGEPPSVHALAGVITAGLMQAEQQIGTLALLDRYRRRCVLLGRTVTVRQGDLSYPATVLGVTEQMMLHVRLQDGSERMLCAGEVSVRA